MSYQLVLQWRQPDLPNFDQLPAMDSDVFTPVWPESTASFSVS